MPASGRTELLHEVGVVVRGNPVENIRADPVVRIESGPVQLADGDLRRLGASSFQRTGNDSRRDAPVVETS